MFSSATANENSPRITRTSWIPRLQNRRQLLKTYIISQSSLDIRAKLKLLEKGPLTLQAHVFTLAFKVYQGRDLKKKVSPSFPASWGKELARTRRTRAGGGKAGSTAWGPGSPVQWLGLQSRLHLALRSSRLALCFSLDFRRVWWLCVAWYEIFFGLDSLGH